jgi:hypothetical protein
VLGQKQNPRRDWGRFAPPFSPWVLCLYTLGDSYTTITEQKNYKKQPKSIALQCF